MQKLTISRCTVSGGQTTPSTSTSDVFEAQINPASYSREHSISYAGNEQKKGAKGRQETAQGRNAVETRFAGINSEKVGFELVLDGTGVIRNSDGSVPDVETEIQQFKNVAYRYVGDKHEPSVVQLNWGGTQGFTFFGRLESMTIDYTLFEPNGLPLRARLKLSFVSFMTLVEAALRAEQSSPDLSHQVQVRDGDTLPLLCHRIYNDSSHYLVVARTNGLSNFRRLQPGTWLRFPALT